MKLSVVIVNYNVRYFLEACLQSLQEALEDIDSEVIVVDNNSTDDSCKMVEEKFPDITLIANKENYGFGRANNQGVSKARGHYVMILNPDTVVEKDLFTKIIEFAKSRHNFGALGVKLIDGRGKYLSESKRGIPTPLVSFYKLIGYTSKRTGKYYANHLKETDTGIIEILVGAFMFMTRKVYIEVSGFDESYFMYGEDIDLSYKILNKGYQNYYYADANCIHYKGESTIKDSISLRHFHKAMEIFYKEHFKVNRVYDFFMRIGIEFWYVLKFFGLKRKVKVDKLPKTVVYFGTDIGVYKKIKHVSKEVSFFEFSDVNNIEGLKTFISSNDIKEVIFDNTDVSYGSIINSILELKSSGVTFKIRPKNSNYFFGSNTSESRGEVFVF